MTNADLDADLQRVYELLVQQVTWEAEGVASIRLVDASGAELPTWTPGAHLDLILPSGKVRQYSLCGAPEDRTSYTVAVLRDQHGRGGSREIHDTALVGRMLSVRGPRNHFRLVDAPAYLFLAGGIGITPILAMAREVSRRGVPWRLTYGGRGKTSMAFLDELEQLGTGNIEIVPQDVQGMLDLDTVLGGAPSDSAIYCCGPEGLIRATEERVGEHFAPHALHVERFGASSSISRGGISTQTESGGESFEVELRRTGAVLTVPSDRTLIDVVREAIPDFLSDCEEGFCGACEARVLEGEPEHHDLLLSDQERERGDRMMICVGRSRSPRLVLDL
ncbi:PDR/VanB family oxidoreductase [Rhodococcus sp. OK302]|uniref:PDR/VanB family oxidoreductase n=1 Tax=Rhodococcus sp. OK302 TaxID=1882769 RepID=UPI000B93FE40|nr:PDR/VanB family oxidoreductase [Rhodococcus sp. OK302]OYD61445.1 ferredoxin-NADP reductase [Rhodococcus sp. OK302]